MKNNFRLVRRCSGFIKPCIFIVATLVLTALALCLCAALSACRSNGKEGGRRLEYVYDEQYDGYIVNAVEEGSCRTVNIPSEFEGESVVGVSCNIFADDTVDEYVFCSQVFFTDTNELVNIDINDKKLYADRNCIDGIRARFYECADDEATRDNAIALANSVSLCGLEEDENYISFRYDWQAYSASGGNVLPVFIGKKGTVFDISVYSEYGYVVHRDKTAISDLDWAYSRGNGNILSDISADGVCVLNGYTLDENAVANVEFERVYRIYVHGGNDGGYDLNTAQPDFCYDKLNGEKLPFRYVTQSGAETFLGGVELRRGFTLSWEYEAHTVSAGSKLKGLNGLPSALSEEKTDLDVYPVWTAEVPQISITSSDGDNVITYGDDVTLCAETAEKANGFTMVYRWLHNGETVGAERSLNLVRPSLSGGYDGVYRLKVTFLDNGNACCEEEAEISLKIKKRSVSVQWSQDKLVYSGGLQVPKAEVIGVDGERVSVEITRLKTPKQISK